MSCQSGCVCVQNLAMVEPVFVLCLAWNSEEKNRKCFYPHKLNKEVKQGKGRKLFLTLSATHCFSEGKREAKGQERSEKMREESRDWLLNKQLSFLLCDSQSEKICFPSLE